MLLTKDVQLLNLGLWEKWSDCSLHPRFGPGMPLLLIRNGNVEELSRASCFIS